MEYQLFTRALDVCQFLYNLRGTWAHQSRDGETSCSLAGSTVCSAINIVLANWRNAKFLDNYITLHLGLGLGLGMLPSTPNTCDSKTAWIVGVKVTGTMSTLQKLENISSPSIRTL